MQECPTCERTFESRRGLGVHHSSVHDERLPNRTCDNCEERFFSNYAKRYCSDECHDEVVSYEGDDNPNYSDATVETECEICGNTFEYYPSNKEGLYCETCVETENWHHEPDISGEEHPRWKGGKRELSCTGCGSRVDRHPWNITSEHVFCSSDCRNDWLSEAFSGDGHPNWKGGGEANYEPGWRRVRERALERDGYTCVVCGTSSEELGWNPDVHHIVPVRRFVETPVTTVRDAHYLENLVSLCIDCHRKAEFGHISRKRLRIAATG